MRGTAVEKDHLLTFKLNRDSGNLAHRPGTDTFGTQLIELARVREDAQVEFGGFFGVVVEPEEWRKFVHGWHGTSQEVSSDKRTSKYQRCATSGLPVIRTFRPGWPIPSLPLVFF